MSRRKQSNPKSIKHEGDDEETDRGVAHAKNDGETDDMETNSPGETIACTNQTPRESICQSDDLINCSLKTRSMSNDQSDVDNKCHKDDESNRQTQETDHSLTKKQPLNSSHGQSASIKSEILNDTELSTVDVDENTKNDICSESCDPSNGKPDSIIKRELSVSPTMEGKGDSDGGCPNHLPSSSLNYKLSNKSRRRNRSRSRSSSKSIGIPSSPDAPPASSQSREEAERALVHQLQLPSDVLYLRQQEMTIQGIPSVGWVVCCAIPLPQGSSLGPFQGQLVPPEAVKVGDLIVQFTNKKGQQALMNVAGESGGWLALLRSAAAKAERNTHVYWEGGRIWCEIIADIEIGTELRATFSFQNEDDIDEEVEDEVASVVEVKHIEGPSSEEINGGVQQLQHPYQQQVAPGHAALIYGCPFCGVRFSSPRTLQGHLSFYCSKKTSDQMVTPVVKDREKGSNQNKSHIEGLSVKLEPGQQLESSSHSMTQSTISNHQPDPEEGQILGSQGKASRPGQIFKCKHCSYKADKLSSLNRHMRMHNNDKARNNSFSTEERELGSNTEGVINSVRSPNSDTFCKECKIQFSNLHTYKCHKEHYCAQRRKKALADPSAFAAMFHSPFSFHDATKVGVPSALQMAALNQGGLILPRTSHDTTGQGTTVLLSAPLLTASGMANIAISVPMLMPQMVTGQDVVAALASPRAKGSSEQHQSHLSTSQLSSHPLPLTHFLNISATTKADYTRALEELHKSKEFTALKVESMEDDHPLDLTITKKEIKFEQDSGKGETQTYSTFLQPDRDGALDARRIIFASPQTSSTSGSNHQPRDLKDNSNSPPLSPVVHGTFKKESLDLKKEAHSSGSQTQIMRSEHLTSKSMIVQVLPHPSIIVSPAGFLSMPLTLSPPAKRAAPLSPSGTANGISKCADCNIVFYKHDNYLIHKKHYCSGKRRMGTQTTDPAFLPAEIEVKTQAEIPQQHSPPASQSPQLKLKKDSQNEYMSSGESSQDTKASPPKHSSEVKYKFYCVPCRIKFSNSSILEAHKEYYCPAGKDSEQSVIVQTASSEAAPVSSPKDDRDRTSPESPPDEFTCTRCNSMFVSARLLRLHVCDGGFPCPHCDHVSITENRLAEHLKVHAPTKAYRCTICGYRGNTARGMRMHGKTHIDEGLDFTDENMLAYHEPALIPVDHSPYPGATTDTELLRLKNEPYKRRRSRKAYEKFDYPLPKVDIPQTCPLCGQNFTNADYLASHFKVHEIAASQYMTGLMKCIQCDYVGKSTENLRSHYETHHTSNRSKRPRISSPGSEEQNSHGRSHSPGIWRSPRTQGQVGSEGNGSVTADQRLSLDELKVKFKSPENDSQNTINEDNDKESISSISITIKSEPMEDCRHDRVSDSKLNHFLQTPSQSPGSSTTHDLDTRQSSSPSSTDTQCRADSPASNLQDGSQSEYMGCPEDERHGSTSCQMETEPGEISFAHIKLEPRFPEDEADVREQFYSHNARDHKVEKCELDSDHRAGKFEPQSSETSEAHHTNQGVSIELSRRSPPFSHGSRRGLSSPKSVINTPNFLVNSPSHTIPSHSPASPSISIRHTSASSSLQSIESPVTTASLTAIFPIHPTQTHAISFPCTTPQLSLPYLFLPPIQSGSSVPLLRSTNIADDRILGARYCQNCDISFSKHATYLAHKKYYCTARPRGEVQSSAKA